MNLNKPFNTKSSKDGKKWETKPTDGIVGGFTFSNGRKSMIYQCGICQKLIEFCDEWNKHHKTHDKNWENVSFGWADPPKWECIKVLESEILEAPKNV